MAIVSELERLRPQLDSISGLTSIEMRLIFDEKTGRPRKVQTALHTARLTADRR